MKNLTKIVAVFLVAAVMTPALAFAHGNGHGNNDDWNRGNRGEQRSLGPWVTNEFGVKVFDENAERSSGDKNDKSKDNNRDSSKHENRGLHLGQFKDRGFMSNMFYNGTVTATSSTGFSIETKDSTTFTVDADSAKIIQIPRTIITLGDVEVGDKLLIQK